MKSAPNDKRVMPLGGAMAIKDPAVLATIDSVNYRGSLEDNFLTDKFCQKYLSWIKSSTSNTLLNLDQFPYYVFSNGTTQAFEMFYIKNKNRRFRCFRGEYIYHQLAWRNNWPNWKFIEDEDIDTNDAVIISLPFSNTGNKHHLTDEILKICNQLNVPVLIDCVYFGACENIEFDFSYQCITDVTFSLSKTFPVANARIGMRLTKIDDDDLMFVYDKINYNNRLSAQLGIELIQNFSPDYIPKKYKSLQVDFSSELNLNLSNTVLFGLDTQNLYPAYNRGSDVNRLSFHEAFINKQIIKDFINASTNK